MNKSNVTLLRIESYDPDQIESSVETIMNNAGYDPALFKNKKIAIKPNLLTSALPESGIITHPSIIEAVINYVKQNGGTPVLVESPAFHPLDKVLKKTGLYDILADLNVAVADTSKTVTIYNETGKQFKNFKVAEELSECDIIINLPKLKTHGLTYFTGCVKNLFGTIHGLEKSKWHFRADNGTDFSSFLIDLYGAIVYGLKKKMIHIMDGIVGLEGEGPGAGGRPRKANALIGGIDAIAVDTVAAAVAGLNLKRVITCLEGGIRSYGVSDLDMIIIEGDEIGFFDNKFAEPSSKSRMSNWPMTSKTFKNLLVEKPVPQFKKCTLCYQCKTICPAGAISKTADSRTPDYDYNKCIRCYCCMEICPENAIVLKKGFIGRFIR